MKFGRGTDPPDDKKTESWWVGLTREEWWEKVKSLSFKYTRYRGLGIDVDDDPGYSNPWSRAQLVNKHRKETGFATWNTGGGVSLTRDRDSLDGEFVPDPVPEQFAKQARCVEAGCLYRSWVSYSNAAWNDYFSAVSYAAELLVLVKHGYEPPFEWDKSGFLRWCDEHKSDVEKQLELVE